MKDETVKKILELVPQIKKAKDDYGSIKKFMEGISMTDDRAVLKVFYAHSAEVYDRINIPLKCFQVLKSKIESEALTHLHDLENELKELKDE